MMSEMGLYLFSATNKQTERTNELVCLYLTCPMYKTPTQISLNPGLDTQNSYPKTFYITCLQPRARGGVGCSSLMDGTTLAPLPHIKLSY